MPYVIHEEVQLGCVFFNSIMLKYILKPGVVVLFTGIVIVDETYSPEKRFKKDPYGRICSQEKPLPYV